MKPIYQAALFLFFSQLSLSAFAQNKTTEQQIAALLQEKESRTPAQQKISSQLLQAIREFRGQQMAPGVNLDPVNVNADAAGNLEVDIKAAVTPALFDKLTGLGASVVSAFKESQAVRAKVNLSYVESIAAFPEVIFIQPAEVPQTNGPGSAVRDAEVKALVEKKRSELAAGKSNSSGHEREVFIREQLKKYFADHPLTGSIASEGDRAHRADEVRAVYGYEGQGVRIGVLSDSYNFTTNAPNDVLTGNLPGTTNPSGNITPVTVIQEGSSTDEGRAMLQLVHDIAPKAQLFFATGNGGQPNFANNIRALRNTHNCDIIIDDLSYFAELVFQDGTVAAAVNDVTAAGALYFSSAANSGSVLKGTAGVFEGDFDDNGAAPIQFPATTGAIGTLHNFGTPAVPQTFDVLTGAGSTYYLKWSDPGAASSNDYDLFLVAASGAIKASSTNIQSGIQDPYEQVSGAGTIVGSDRLIVFKKTAAAIRTFHLNANRGRLGIATNGQTGGHSAAVNAFSMAATPAATPFAAGAVAGPFPGTFNSGNTVETFSSDGPRRIFFNQNGTLAVPGTPTIAGSGGVIRNKPDLTAADGISTTFANSTGLNAFYGTSASAPNAGAIAALLKSGNLALTAAQIRTILINTAIDMEAPGFDVNSGYGNINAFAAAQAIATSPTLRLTGTAATEGTFLNYNGYLDPGETGNRFTATLNNSSGGSATNVTAVLSSPTSGVTITQNTASYGTLAPGGAGTNSATPFRFNIDAGVACGSDIHFVLNVTYGGGGSGTQVFEIDVPVGRKPVDSIFTTLGSPQASAGFQFSTGFQTGRLGRTAVGTGPACGVLKANPGLFTAAGNRVYDAYRFSNTGNSTQCVTVAVGAPGGLLFSAAYGVGVNGFTPSDPSANYLADPGTISGNGYYAFNTAPGTSFTVVVHEVNPGTAAGMPYNLTVNFGTCAGGLVVPVKWLAFTAQEQKRTSLLTWKVANEINVAGYDVEWSTDGRTFKKLTYLAATSPTPADKSYTWLHTAPVSGTNYYRIRQLDHNGRFDLSLTEIVRLTDREIISVMPNPATDFITVRAGSAIKEILLLSMSGQVLQQIKSAGTTSQLDVRSLPRGEYLIRIQTAENTVTEKIIKAK